MKNSDDPNFWMLAKAVVQQGEFDVDGHPDDDAIAGLVSRESAARVALDRAQRAVKADGIAETLPPEAKHDLLDVVTAAWMDAFMIALRYQSIRATHASADEKVTRLRRWEAYRQDYVVRERTDKADEMAHQIAGLVAELDSELSLGAPLPGEWIH